MVDSRRRCAWIKGERMRAYHDREWGVPVWNDRELFEHLVLDGFQAGLSWAVILDKREGFRRAFHGFDPERMARYDGRSTRRLLADPGIVRNRLKIEAAIANARAFLDVQEGGSFAELVWSVVGGVPRQNRWRTLSRLPARTRQSDRLSGMLKERGFKFTGTTICYAFMQAAGLVNDHVVTCFRHREVARMAGVGQAPSSSARR